jgi:hypothetical protein
MHGGGGGADLPDEEEEEPVPGKYEELAGLAIQGEG